jgi:hypothetical protein
MASPAQIAANRLNAQRSTGPRSVEGKSVSRFNALKHGVDAASIVIPGEDPAAYQALVDSYAKIYKPLNAVQHFLVDSLVHAGWHTYRLQRQEADLVRKLLAETPGASLIDVMLSDSPGAKLYARIQRQIAAHERAWFRAHRELVRLAELQAEAPQAMPLDLPMPGLPAIRPQSKLPEPTQFPAIQGAVPHPHIDETTGEFRYLVG